MKHLLASFAALCALATSLLAAPPNLVIFIADDFSFNDLHCWGSPDAKTPNLDKLASEGMKLTRLYTAAPTCSPTRAALNEVGMDFDKAVQLAREVGYTHYLRFDRLVHKEMVI